MNTSESDSTFSIWFFRRETLAFPLPPARCTAGDHKTGRSSFPKPTQRSGVTSPLLLRQYLQPFYAFEVRSVMRHQRHTEQQRGGGVPGVGGLDRLPAPSAVMHHFRPFAAKGAAEGVNHHLAQVPFQPRLAGLPPAPLQRP